MTLENTFGRLPTRWSADLRPLIGGPWGRDTMKIMAYNEINNVEFPT